MTHLPKTEPIHRYTGDPFTHKITVTGLMAAQVTVATWKAGALSKTLGSGISVADEAGVAVLSVTVSTADTTALGVGTHEWQAAAGGTNPPIVAAGVLEILPRL